MNDIAESLEQFGQYRSIVATQDMTVLAGHHVLQAAKNIGLKTVRVDVVEADEKTAKKILLADNRLAELGPGYDLDILLKDLEDLEGDFIGTGFDDEYVKLLESAVSGVDEPDDDEPEESDRSGMQKLTLAVTGSLAAQWEAHRQLFPDDTSAFSYLFGS